MNRYFIEVAYKGTRYSGFQIQENAATVQSELAKALQTYYRQPFELTGSSRTDAGVHALQNYFHFDTEADLQTEGIYNVNAILPRDIAILSLRKVRPDAHCRFSATSRLYDYYIYTRKNPFLTETAWYYPYSMDMELLNATAEMLLGSHDFQSFSKRNTQVHTYICDIKRAEWRTEGEKLVFTVESNRFLRGMVRALTATQLKVGRKSIDLESFKNIVSAQDCTKADFSAPAHGLFLSAVRFPADTFL